MQTELKIQDQSGNSHNHMLPAVFSSVEEAVLKLNLKGKYKSFCGNLCQWTTDPRPQPVYYNGYVVQIK
jgi:hypothetical protein